MSSRLRLSERTVIDDARWRATIERVEIGAGLRVFLTDAQARRDITIEAHANRTEQWMASQVTVAGRANIDFLDGRQTHATAEQAVFFRPSGGRAAYDLAAGATFRSAGYSLDIERIRRLFDGDVPAILRPLIEPEIRESCFVASAAGSCATLRQACSPAASTARCARS